MGVFKITDGKYGCMGVFLGPGSTMIRDSFLKVTLRSSRANITASLIFCPITVLKHAASRMAGTW